MEQIYFRDLANAVWKSRWWIVVCVISSVGVALFVIVNSPRQYQISMTLIPSGSGQQQQSTPASGLVSSVAGQLLGLTPDRGTQTVQQFLQLFTSPLTIAAVDKEQNILPRLFPGFWDEAKKQWVPPRGIRQDIVEALKGHSTWTPPGPVDGGKLLSKQMTLEMPRASSIVHVSYKTANPEFGVTLLNALYKRTDDYMRDRARGANNEHIAYIQRVLNSVGYSDTRQSLTGLLTTELGQKVMINSGAPYAMEILEPPTVSTDESSPGPVAYIAVACFVGVGAGIILSMVISALWRSQRERRRAPRAYRPNEDLGVNGVGS
jgi:uncharacterized protein involved in exopolysaccharide biosynthesis